MGRFWLLIFPFVLPSCFWIGLGCEAPPSCRSETEIQNCQSVTVCDEGFACVEFSINNPVCAPACGDDTFEPDLEECDASSVGCDQSCEVSVTPTCGDGISQPGEICSGPTLTQSTDSELRLISLIDLDQDGDLDLLTSVPNEASLHLFTNDGAASFLDRRALFSFPFGNTLEAGDLNGDGLLDLVFSDDEKDLVRIEQQQNNLNFVSTEIPIQDPFLFTLAELNGDGFLDLVVDHKGDVSPRQLSLFLGDGVGGFGAPLTLLNHSDFSSPRLLAVDLDGDQRGDLLFSHDAEVDFLQNLGGATFTVSTLLTSDGSFRDIKLGDLNGDGLLDLVLREQTINIVLVEELLIFQNTGGAMTETQRISPISTNFELIDDNGDGLVELFSFSQALAQVFPNQGNQLGEAQFLDLEQTRRALLSGDLNRDGLLDFLYTKGLPSELVVQLGTN